jgi:large subunit ribosomal protein L23
MKITQVIKGPLITEKLDRARESFRQYSFVVDREATKHDVERAVETLFNVKVEAVRTIIMRGKPKRMGRSMGQRSNFKKAIVTLKEGDKIDLFEGAAA